MFYKQALTSDSRRHHVVLGFFTFTPFCATKRQRRNINRKGSAEFKKKKAFSRLALLCSFSPSPVGGAVVAKHPYFQHPWCRLMCVVSWNLHCECVILHNGGALMKASNNAAGVMEQKTPTAWYLQYVYRQVLMHTTQKHYKYKMMINQIKAQIIWTVDYLSFLINRHLCLKTEK